MGTQIALDGDPISFVLTLILGVMQLAAFVVLVLFFCRTYWKQIFAAATVAAAVHGLLVYSAPTEQERCIAAAEKSGQIFEMYLCE